MQRHEEMADAALVRSADVGVRRDRDGRRRPCVVYGSRVYVPGHIPDGIYIRPHFVSARSWISASWPAERPRSSSRSWAAAGSPSPQPGLDRVTSLASLPRVLAGRFPRARSIRAMARLDMGRAAPLNSRDGRGRLAQREGARFTREGSTGSIPAPPTIQRAGTVAEHRLVVAAAEVEPALRLPGSRF